MSQETIDIYCTGINCDAMLSLPIPQGWKGTADVEHGLWCDKQQCCDEKAWFDAVCGGCVEGYPGCSFEKRFAFSSSQGFSEDALNIIRSGRCPERTNGTFFMSRDGFERVDLSEQALPCSGAAVADAVVIHYERWVANQPQEATEA